MSPNNISNVNQFDSNQKVLFIGPPEMMPEFSSDKVIVVDDFTTPSQESDDAEDAQQIIRTSNISQFDKSMDKINLDEIED